MKSAVRAAPLAALVSCCVLTGCASRHAATVPVVRVSERDFTIAAPRSVPSGEVRLVVHNEGPVEHELLLARAAGGRLPLRTDGFTIDEEALERRLVAVVEPQPPGRDVAIDLKLLPGRYVLFCNMAGHYAAGMVRVLQVR